MTGRNLRFCEGKYEYSAAKESTTYAGKVRKESWKGGWATLYRSPSVEESKKIAMQRRRLLGHHCWKRVRKDRILCLKATDPVEEFVRRPMFCPMGGLCQFLSERVCNLLSVPGERSFSNFWADRFKKLVLLPIPGYTHVVTTIYAMCDFIAPCSGHYWRPRKTRGRIGPLLATTEFQAVSRVSTTLSLSASLSVKPQSPPLVLFVTCW
jgi:hypothetical protein